ncbi:cst complex subunit ten1 [Anaeramoeba flamelloides]|uniref:Cst complex subunit ten1 n=1 Tax=Anaeramoeba flamelloides TaxID=1746091 RepID=A0AAV7ZJX7_9EUKA|nr:cst complex subunit ten1 [Anaeramoeba flamelloides]
MDKKPIPMGLGKFVPLKNLPNLRFQQTINVTVIGIMHLLDRSNDRLILEDEGFQLRVDISLLSNIKWLGKMYLIIGELNKIQEQEQALILTAKIARNVDGLDLELYKKTEYQLDKFLKNNVRNHRNTNVRKY